MWLWLIAADPPPIAAVANIARLAIFAAVAPALFATAILPLSTSSWNTRSLGTLISARVLPRPAGVVELDDALETFDPVTRRATRGAIRGLSDGFAGRGAELNRTPDLIWDVLHDGARRARGIAESVMVEAREAIGLARKMD